MNENYTHKMAQIPGLNMKAGPFIVCNGCTEGKAKPKNVPQDSDYFKATKETPRVYFDISTVCDTNGDLLCQNSMPQLAWNWLTRRWLTQLWSASLECQSVDWLWSQMQFWTEQRILSLWFQVGWTQMMQSALIQERVFQGKHHFSAELCLGSTMLCKTWWLSQSLKLKK